MSPRGASRRRSSTHSVPETRYWRRSPSDSTSPATKPPPGAWCPRRKRCTATSPGDRQQQADQHRRHHEVAHRRVAHAARVEQVGLEVGRQRALLGGERQRLPGRPEAPQQGVDRERHQRQHHHLAEGVEAPEVHQDDVHHVAAAALGECALEEEGGGRLGQVARRHRVGDRGHPAAAATATGCRARCAASAPGRQEGPPPRVPRAAGASAGRAGRAASSPPPPRAGSARGPARRTT